MLRIKIGTVAVAFNKHFSININICYINGARQVTVMVLATEAKVTT